MVTTAYQLVIDWDNNGSYAGTYDDVSSDTLQIQYRRGRDYASQVSGNSTAGKLTAYLNNEGGKYSPSNAASVLSGNLTVGRPVQFRIGPTGDFPYVFPAEFSEEAVPMWTGKLESIIPEPSGTGLNRVVLTAVGPLGYLNDQIPITEQETNIRTDEAIGKVLDKAGWPLAERDLDVGQTSMVRWWSDSDSTITALRVVEETENGFVKEKANGYIGFESRNTRLLPPYVTPVATFSDASTAPYTYLQLEQKDPLETIINRFDASYRSYSSIGIVDLWTFPDTGADSPLVVSGETLQVIAEYPTTSSAPEAVAVSAWQNPLAYTDITANTDPNGTGNDATGSLVITQTKVANQMRIAITNNYDENGTGKNVYLTMLKARGTPVTLRDNSLVTQEDLFSISKYGERKFTADTPFFPTLSNAQSWCNYNIQMYSTPINVMTMTFSANVSQNNMNAATQFDISDRITLVATANAELGVNEDFFIEEVNHSITDGGQVHMVTYKLSPAESGYTQFWKLDAGALGSTTVPAY